MKALSDLAEQVGRMKEELERLKDDTTAPSRKRYVSKIKGSVRLGPNAHFGVDHTGKTRVVTRKLPKVVSDGTYEEVCQLLRQGANPQTADSKGRTPLHFAACRGEAGICQVLVSHGASVNEQDNIGNTPLHLACTAGHVGVVTVLLRAGTNLMSTDRRGSTPLHLALSRLRVLNINPIDTSTPNQRKREMEKIIEMVREYLSVRAEVGEEDEDVRRHLASKTNDIGELEQLAGQLSLSETQEQVDEVQCLLQSFTELSINRLESHNS